MRTVALAAATALALASVANPRAPGPYHSQHNTAFATQASVTPARPPAITLGMRYPRPLTQATRPCRLNAKGCVRHQPSRWRGSSEVAWYSHPLKAPPGAHPGRPTGRRTHGLTK